MASPKYRDYFITINEDAECYADVLEIVKELNIKLYGYIVHDKDEVIEEDEHGEITRTPKRVHKHVVLELRNPITFQSMQKKFPGAHIEVIRYKKAAYQYLIHNSPKSKEKYHYSLDDIISNNIAEVQYAIEAEEGLETFKENMFLTYIAEGTTTCYQFTKRFGLNVYRQYFASYNDMMKALNSDQEMQEDYWRIKKALENDLPF